MHWRGILGRRNQVALCVQRSVKPLELGRFGKNALGLGRPAAEFTTTLTLDGNVALIAPLAWKPPWAEITCWTQ